MAEEKKSHDDGRGRPVGDNQNSLTVGPRGPVVFEDFLLFEKMAHFNRERIPERVVHAKGSGAHGHFVCTTATSPSTPPRSCFQQRRQEDADVHPLFHRRRRKGFGGHRARSARLRAEVLHRRGQLGHDGQQHAGLLHSRSAEVRRFHPHAEARSANQSEIAHHDVGFLVAVAGVAASGDDSVLRPRHSGRLSPHGRIQQPHLQPDQRQERTVLREMALQDQARHQEFHARVGRAKCAATIRTTRSAICSMPSRRATSPSGASPCRSCRKRKRRPITSIRSTSPRCGRTRIIPLHEVGELELNRNPENYFAEVEQAAFEPRNVVPGMGFSPDKMLQARLISYPDAHRYRLGVNYDSLPVNKPQCPFHTYNRDGAMRFDGNGGAAPNYEPNSFGGPTQDPDVRRAPEDGQRHGGAPRSPQRRRLLLAARKFVPPDGRGRASSG